MTTDFRALCAELTKDLKLLFAYGGIHPSQESHDLIERARAALAELEPPTEREVAELVAELIRTANDLDDDWYHGSARVARRAADLLERLAPQPVTVTVTEGPSDEELYDYWISTSPELGCANPVGFARAVLARWGRQPAPDAPAPCPPGG